MIYAISYGNSAQKEEKETYRANAYKLADIKAQIESLQAQFEVIQAQLDAVESETGVQFTERPTDWATESLTDEIQSAIELLEDWAN